MSTEEEGNLNFINGIIDHMTFLWAVQKTGLSKIFENI